MANLSASRLTPLAGLALINKPGEAEISDVGLAARYLYRGVPAALDAAFGVALPTKPCQAAFDHERAALWLGPDEWLLIAPPEQSSDLLIGMRLALPDKPASLVDVSHRNFGLFVSGARSADLLASGCPLDLGPSAFPIGMCARTVFAKSEIVLWRIAGETFRLEAWRSFAPYIVGLLNEAAGRLP
jgi:sarcosine oxidase subunit gamma